MPMDERQERIGCNEILFRDVNERLRELNDAFSLVSEHADFVCECGNRGCTAQITMTLAEYEALRGDPELFAVLPEHESGDVEVVERRGVYNVIRKKAGEPAALAVEHDPRA